jgi:hypothetical protein
MSATLPGLTGTWPGSLLDRQEEGGALSGERHRGDALGPFEAQKQPESKTFSGTPSGRQGAKQVAQSYSNSLDIYSDNPLRFLLWDQSMNDHRPIVAAVGTGAGLTVLVILLALALHTVRSNLAGRLQSAPIAPNEMLHPASVAGPALLLVALMVAPPLWLRLHHTRRILASRVSLVVLAADDFDPSEDAVVRAAGQLGRIRRVVLGWLDTRASCVRLRLDSESGGQMAYRAETAGRARSVVHIAFSSLGHLEVRNQGMDDNQHETEGGHEYTRQARRVGAGPALN